MRFTAFPTILSLLFLFLTPVKVVAQPLEGEAPGDQTVEDQIAGEQTADEVRPFVEGRVEPLNIMVDRFGPPDANQVVWVSEPFSHAGSSYLILYLDQIDDRTQVPYRLRIVGPSGRLLDEIGREELARAPELSSKLLTTTRATLEVVAEEIPSGLSFRIAGLGFQERGRAVQSVYGQPNFEHLVDIDDPRLRRSAEAVAKLHLRIDHDLPVCTGFLVAPRHLLTNYHCISEQSTCDTALARFGYQRNEDGTETPGESLRCRRLVDVDHGLDAALIELEGRPGDTWGWLVLADDGPHQGQKLVMVQHPGGKPKQVVRKSCRAKPNRARGRARDTDFGHRCDSEEGSSGSPMLDRSTLEVVGLHHWGFSRLGYWKNRNRAVRMDELHDFLATALAPSPPNPATPSSLDPSF